MKTKRSLATILAVAIGVLASAIEKPKMSFEALNSDRAIVTVLNKNAAHLEVSIFTDKNEMVYFKQTDKPLTSYQKIFDFENLENGDYLLKIKVDNVQNNRWFSVTSTKIYIGESKEIFEPYYDFDGKDLKFSLFNNNEENYKLKIYNDYGLIYKSKIGSDTFINSGYDLSNLEDGKYRVVLASGSNEFVYNLEK